MLVVVARFVQELNSVCCRFRNFLPQRVAASFRSLPPALALGEPQTPRRATGHPSVLQFVAANPTPPSIDEKLWTRRICDETPSLLASAKANQAPIPTGSWQGLPEKGRSRLTPPIACVKPPVNGRCAEAPALLRLPVVPELRPVVLLEFRYLQQPHS